ncbi:MAG: hypothetical protein ACREOI_25875 [bacterium]
MEVTLQLSPPLSESVREIANKRFKGNLTAVLNAALEFYLDKDDRKRQELKKLVREIQQEVQARGGIDEKDLDRRIREYRRAKYAKTR